MTDLYARLRKIHTPRDTEAEWWADGPGEEFHDERWPECPAVVEADDARCEGHIFMMQVCSECGYEHGDSYPVYRPWPCPTIEAITQEEPNNLLGLLCLAGFVACVWASNWLLTRYGLVDVGYGLTAPAGVYTAGLAFGLRDALAQWVDPDQPGFGGVA